MKGQIQGSIIYCLLLFFSIQSYGQQQLFVDGQIDYGYLNRSFLNNGSVLKSRKLGSELNLRTSLSYRVFNRIQIAAGISLNRQSLPFRDDDFTSRNEGFEVEMRSLTWYTSYFASLKYSQKLRPNTYLYGKVGYEHNLIKTDSKSAQDVYVANFETVDLVSSYADVTQSVVPEIGLEFFTHNGNMFGVGFKYTHMLDPMMNASYVVTQGGTVIATDEVTVSGSNIALGFHYHYKLWGKAKKERIPKIKKPTKTEVVPTTPAEEKVVPISDNSVNDRAYVITHKVKVVSPTITVSVWDHQIEDGDIISLLLNDKWVIQNYKLTKKKKIFTLQLNEGNNSFILYAQNLGKYSPNTAAIIVDDGVKEHKIVLESNLKESGALEIKYNPKKNK